MSGEASEPCHSFLFFGGEEAGVGTFEGVFSKGNSQTAVFPLGFMVFVGLVSFFLVR